MSVSTTMKARIILKWIGISVGAIVGLALLGVAIVYLMIGRDLSRTFDVALTEVAVPDDLASTTEGQRLARLRGCFGGCHGEKGTGQVFFEIPDGTKLVAPDLAIAAQKYSAAELERIIRHGVRPDGTSVVLVMPSAMLYNLSDEDVGSIIRFLQTLAPGEEPLPESYFGPLARLMLLGFKQETGTLLAAESINHDQERFDPSPSSPEMFGKYIAMTSCTECHGQDLGGRPGDEIPPLTIVAAYSLEDFTTLLRTGTPIGDRKLDLMAGVAVSRFANFTDLEIAALHAFLKTLVHS
jgi:cytochrome c553